MGRSNPNTYVKNPAKCTLEWVGAEGCGFFETYDSEKKEKIELDLPMRFLWLESLATMVGWNENDEIRYLANEVKSTRTDTLTVFHYESNGKQGDERKQKKVVDWEGFYQDIKPEANAKGAKYATVVYAMVETDNGILKAGDIVRIIMRGAALSAWIDKGFGDAEGGIAVYEAAHRELKKGRNTIKYEEPIFKQETCSAEISKLADLKDVEVQKWLSQDASGAPEKSEPAKEAPADFDEYEDDIPF